MNPNRTYEENMAALKKVLTQRTYCRLTSFSRSLQTILRINLDGTAGWVITEYVLQI